MKMLGQMIEERSPWLRTLPARAALRLRNLPARAALRLCNQPQVRSWLGSRYAKSLDGYRPALPRLTGLDGEIAAALETVGVYRTSLESLQLAGSSALLETAGRLAEDFAPTARALASNGQNFIIVPPADIAANPAIYLFGLQDRLLDIAEAYLGMPVAYDGVAINYTVADGREISTRKWHRDWEDRRMLKIAVYLHDVNEDGGPFQHICRQDTLQNDGEGYRYELADNAELERRLGRGFADDIVSCTGPRGTVILNDTARFFHRGKPAIAHDRAALFYSYFANPPRHPFLCERTGLSRAQIAAMARGLPERQRQVALWRSRLPAPLRLIPPATL